MKSGDLRPRRKRTFGREGAVEARATLDVDGDRSRYEAAHLLAGWRPRRRLRAGPHGRPSLTARQSRSAHQRRPQGLSGGRRRSIRRGRRLRHAGQDLRRGSGGAKGRYSPAECIGARKEPIDGNPDLKHVNTSLRRTPNLTMRMQMRRFTRLTNAFSQEIRKPHAHGRALYRLVQLREMHKTLRGFRRHVGGVNRQALVYDGHCRACGNDVAEGRPARFLQKIGRRNFKLRHRPAVGSRRVGGRGSADGKLTWVCLARVLPPFACSLGVGIGVALTRPSPCNG